MNSILAATLAVLSMFAAPGVGAPQRDASAAAREVEQVENDRLASMEKGDIDAVARVIADDFIVTGADGRTSGKSEYLERLRRASSPRPHLIHDEVSIRVYGDAAVITGRSRSVRNGQEQPGHVRYIHVYTHRSGAWQMVSMQVTQIAPAP